MGAEERSLDNIELLRPLSDVERQAIGQHCHWRHFRAGEQILDRDSATNDVLLITGGEVRIVHYSANGRETAFAVFSAGSHVGEIAAIDGMARSASVVAISACTVAILPAERFMELVKRHSAVAIEVLRHLTKIIRTTNERIAELSTVGAVQRVYRELLRLAETSPSRGGSAISSLPTQQDLASKVGSTRETVARALGQLMKLGVVERRGRTLFIRDRDMLAMFADPDGDGAP
ncbi:MAG: Crp/Fnr family transcriptional regulator [Geminicoccaceae bacterium]